MNTIKELFRLLARKILRIGENETVSDGLNKKYVRIKKRIDHRKITKKELAQCLKSIGLKQGDTVIVHCAWRNCYQLDLSPQELIDSIINIIGKNGNLLMPTYGSDDTFLDILNTPSHAGVISEIFRTSYDSIRSLFPVGTMSAYGPDKVNLTKMHAKSQYGFDNYSPYWLATSKYNAKVLLIGLGKHPHKISIFHCSSFKYYRDRYYNEPKVAKVIDARGRESSKKYIDRNRGLENDKRAFRKIFDKVDKKMIHKKGLVIVGFESLTAYKEGCRYCANGGSFYRRNWR